MKKSTKILLTLFLPTLSAGCSDTSHQNTAVRRDCSTPAQPGEPPKEPCPPQTSGSGTSHGTSTTNRVSHSHSYFPFFMPWMSSSGTSSPSDRQGGHFCHQPRIHQQPLIPPPVSPAADLGGRARSCRVVPDEKNRWTTANRLAI